MITTLLTKVCRLWDRLFGTPKLDAAVKRLCEALDDLKNARRTSA